MRIRSLLPLLLVTLAAAKPPDEQVFTLYKWQQRLGFERSYIVRDPKGSEIRTVFNFTDRSTPVPLAALLRLDRDGTPMRFQEFGATSRLSDVDDLVVAGKKTLTITQHGATRTATAPARFFVASGYAPVIVTQELVRYWSKHGQPASLPVFTARRGHDHPARRGHGQR
jgi:hypothetical protein